MTDLSATLTQHERMDMQMRPLGLGVPYILVTVSGDGSQGFTYDMETGGGIPVGETSGVADVLELLAAAIRDTDPEETS